ncbi:hypothetical protein [Mycolicibacterium septicum]|uniref:hypothetical protein n=1 Tax=Mycolicibacterium septicum TaxID=98668 RepID=UPI0023602F11|nr:hypothetical protein [Mycolicibacterium septicum]
MTNANLPERWLNDMRFRRKRLSDSAYRSYMQALVWSVANRTEGIIERGDVEEIPDFNPADVHELIKVGLWEAQERDRWLIHDFDDTQSGKDLLEAAEKRRAWDRKRKAQARKEALEAKLAGLASSGGSSSGQVPPERASTNQTKPNALRGGTEKNASSNDDDAWRDQYQAELQRKADRIERDGYES